MGKRDKTVSSTRSRASPPILLYIRSRFLPLSLSLSPLLPAHTRGLTPQSNKTTELSRTGVSVLEKVYLALRGSVTLREGEEGKEVRRRAENTQRPYNHKGNTRRRLPGGAIVVQINPYSPKIGPHRLLFLWFAEADLSSLKAPCFLKANSGTIGKEQFEGESEVLGWGYTTGSSWKFPWSLSAYGLEVYTR